MHWLTLAFAILCEVFATTMLKLSDGFTRPLPLLGMTLGYALSFYALALTLKTLPLGAAYAIWGGVVVVFGEKTDTAGIVGIAFILVGLVILNVFSRMTGH